MNQPSSMSRARKIFSGLCLSAGVLAIANVETVWQEYHHGDKQETHALVSSNNKWLPKSVPANAEANPNYKPLQSALSRSLEQDELKEQNPFAHLSNLDPLQEIMRQGINKFHRETFRSPTYQEESGYDMISYEIEHSDGSRSSILAYLEKPEGGSESLPFVVFMVSNNDGSRYSFYRGGTLVEQSQLTTGEAQAFVAQRLSAGIPFLSVSR